jgi:hypothetical protein
MLFMEEQKMSGIIRLDKVKSTRTGHIYNVRSADELDNGSIGFLNGTIAGERELYALGKYATATIATKAPVLVAAPEIVADEATVATKKLSAFKNPANLAVRAYELHVGDIFSVSADMVNALGAKVVVGNSVIATNASYKFSEIASPAGTEKFTGKIIDVEAMGTVPVQGGGNVYDYVVIEVTKI